MKEKFTIEESDLFELVDFFKQECWIDKSEIEVREIREPLPVSEHYEDYVTYEVQGYAYCVYNDEILENFLNKWDIYLEEKEKFEEILSKIELVDFLDNIEVIFKFVKEE